MTSKTQDATRPLDAICVNSQCPYNRRGKGCTLFEGSAWLRCRKARIATKAARKAGRS